MSVPCDLLCSKTCRLENDFMGRREGTEMAKANRRPVIGSEHWRDVWKACFQNSRTLSAGGKISAVFSSMDPARLERSRLRRKFWAVRYSRGAGGRTIPVDRAVE